MPPIINRRTALKTLAAGLFAAAGPQSFAAAASEPTPAAAPASTRPAKPRLGLHLEVGNDDAARTLAKQLPALAALGMNAVVAEVDYGFEFQSHPELHSGSFITRRGAKALSAACREHGIRLIPQLNCLGHQSWAAHTAPLLTKFPQFDETPDKYPANKGIYCRSWCPLHPEVNGVVFALMDELIDGFEADAFHVGMDEVFLIASEFCPRCKGKDPAELFAKAVNDYHDHLVGKRRVEMLMWGDRLLDAKSTGYGKWEASNNHTAPAIDQIPTDVVVCDWHYEKRQDYPSIPLFLEKGFSVWPCGWDKEDATAALVDCELKCRKGEDERKDRGPKRGEVVGHLCSTWGKVKIDKMPDWPPVRAAMKKWQEAQG